MVDDIGLEYIFCHKQKIKVAASVCTGVSNMPPACCTAMGSSPNTIEKKKNHTEWCGFFFWWTI